ncbi:Anti-sigma-K factor RskA [Fodinibius roseus]|uniref:Anti-sigma-K factor RskA n=1 Tax=Fodinibius roseus TaxID=1194090 RepID=A0A1M4W997_9BACT|nr:anti-sigma factor [Fodinibius roseus]SHE77814.1 Anti-sigma-K factor RskA [Fodinibius roseus]
MANEHSHNKTFKERCAGYLLQTLDADERKAFEQMLENATEEQQRLYREMRSVANQPSFTQQPGESSESLKKRLMERIPSEEEDPEAEEIPSPPVPAIEEDLSSENEGDEDMGAEAGEEPFNWATFSTAASFALLILSLSLLFYSFNLSAEINDQESVIDDQQAEITGLEEELRRKEKMLAILESQGLEMVLMSGLEVNPDGYGKVIWDSENRRALLQVSNLPHVPPDKEYQLWIIQNNEPVSAGVFAVSDTSDTFFTFEETADARNDSASAFAITMEPKGGMPQPTGDMYLLGNMNSDAEGP